MISAKTISQCYILAGCYNLGIIPASKFFQEDMGKIDSIFDPSGCLLIVLWGMAYIAASPIVEKAPALSMVFGVEKVFYSLRWAVWVNSQTLDSIRTLIQDDMITGLFFSLYGIGDGLFATLFLYSAVTLWKQTPSDSATKKRQSINTASASRKTS